MLLVSLFILYIYKTVHLTRIWLTIVDLNPSHLFRLRRTGSIGCSKAPTTVPSFLLDSGQLTIFWFARSFHQPPESGYLRSECEFVTMFQYWAVLKQMAIDVFPKDPKKKNKMKPTNPNADTYVDKQRQYLFVTSPANSFVRHPEFTHWGDTLV